MQCNSVEGLIDHLVHNTRGLEHGFKLADRDCTRDPGLALGLALGLGLDLLLKTARARQERKRALIDSVS